MSGVLSVAKELRCFQLRCLNTRSVTRKSPLKLKAFLYSKYYKAVICSVNFIQCVITSIYHKASNTYITLITWFLTFRKEKQCPNNPFIIDKCPRTFSMPKPLRRYKIIILVMNNRRCSLQLHCYVM